MRLGPLSLAIGLLVAGGAARADEPQKRPVPDYDGRPGPGPGAGEVLIWIPRTILLPGYLLTEYVIRRPLGALVSYLDRTGAITRFLASKAPVGGFPTALVDFGLRPSLGLYLFADPFLHPDNRFRVSFAYGGDAWLSIAAKDRLILADDDGGELIVRAGFSRRPDYPFYGIGPDARQGDESFYAVRRLEVALALGMRLRHVAYEASAHLFRDRRGESDFGRSAAQAFDVDAIPDFAGATLHEQSLAASVDSRPAGRAFGLSTGSGARLDVRGGLAFGLDDPARKRFVRYGAEVSLFWDITGTRRVLGLNVQLDEVDGLGGAPVPLSYLLQMGGRESMPGFYLGRFVGESTTSATLDYRWPVATFLDAELFAGVGNAFGRRFTGFAPGALVGDAGLAIRTNTSRDLSFDFVVAVGTRRFDEGPLDVDSFRLNVGTNRGF